MELYHSPASPFVRKVLVLLHELDKADAVTLRSVATTALAPDPDLMAAHPMAKLPALVRPGAPTLYDSRVITAYLDDLFAGGFYPEGAARWDTLTLEATGDEIMVSAVLMTYETRLRAAPQQSQDWIEAQWGKISRALDALESRWMSHLSGPLRAGHISVGCALGYLDLRHDARGWRSGRPDLAQWFETFAARPAMQATDPAA